MSKQLFANNDRTTLAGGITAAATTVNVAAATGAIFPQPTGTDFFMATFVAAANVNQKEIVKVTGWSGDTATIIRAQEGTVAQNWAAGDIFAALITAGTFQSFDQTNATPGKLLGVLTYAAGTFTPFADLPVGTNTVDVFMQAPGGSGGACALTGGGVANVASSGGAGAWLRARMAATLLSAASLVLPSGAAAPAAGNNNGSDAASATLGGTLMIAPGGKGGLAGTASAGPQLVGSQGHSAAPSVAGGPALIAGSSGQTGNAGFVLSPTALGSGFGGCSSQGPGGEVAINGAGGDAIAPGAGGSGAGIPASHAAAAGGKGGDAMAIFMCYS